MITLVLLAVLGAVTLLVLTAAAAVTAVHMGARWIADHLLPAGRHHLTPRGLPDDFWES